MADGEIKIGVELDDAEAKSQSTKTGQQIAEGVEKGLKGAASAAKDAESEINGSLKNVSSDAAAAFSKVESKAASAFSGVESEASKGGANAGDAFASKFEAGAKNVSGVVSGVESETAKAKAPAKSNGETAGDAFADGFESSATSALEKVGGALAGVIGAAAIGNLLFEAVDVANDFGEDMGKLEVAFTSQGFSVQTANEAYRDFVGILGETDQSVEAVNHLAQLTDSEEELAAWTDIAAGVYAQFGDSLPLEGLTEAVNETAKVAQVTGPLADALNWASLSADEWSAALAGNADAQAAFDDAIANGENVEDAFTAALQAAGDETERSTLLTNALSAAYSEAGQAYQETNAAVVEYRQAQSDLNSELNNLGQSVMPLASMGMGVFADALGVVAEIAANTDVAGMLADGDFAGAGQELASGVSVMVEYLIEQLPHFLTAGVEFVGGLAIGIVEAIPSMLETITGAVMEAVPLLVEAAFNVVTALMEALPEITQALVDMVPQIITAIAEMLPTTIDVMIQGFIALFNAVIEALPQIIEALVAAIPTIVIALVTALTSSVDALVNGFIQLFMAFVQALPIIIETIVPLIPTIVTSVISALIAALPTLIQGFIQLFMAFVQALPQIISIIVSQIPSIISAIFSAVVSGAGQIGQAAQNLFDQFISFIGSLPERMVSMGADLVHGIWNGINDTVDWILGKIRGFGDAVMNGIKSIFGIASPSKRMRDEVGYWLGAGLWEGFELSDPMGAMVASMEDGIAEMEQAAADFDPEFGNPDNPWDGVVEAGGKLARGLVVGFREADPMRQIRDTVTSGAAALSARMGGVTNNTNNTTNSQVINVNQPVQSPDELARYMRMQQRYGLAGAYA